MQQARRGRLALTGRSATLVAAALFAVPAPHGPGLAADACAVPALAAPARPTPFAGRLRPAPWPPGRPLRLVMGFAEAVCAGGPPRRTSSAVHAELTRRPGPSGGSYYRAAVTAVALDGARIAPAAGPLMVLQETWSADGALTGRRLDERDLAALAATRGDGQQADRLAGRIVNLAPLDIPGLLPPDIGLALGSVEPWQVIPPVLFRQLRAIDLDCTVTGLAAADTNRQLVARCRGSAARLAGTTRGTVDVSYGALIGAGTGTTLDATTVVVSRFLRSGAGAPVRQVQTWRIRLSPP